MFDNFQQLIFPKIKWPLTVKRYALFWNKTWHERFPSELANLGMFEKLKMPGRDFGPFLHNILRLTSFEYPFDQRALMIRR